MNTENRSFSKNISAKVITSILLAGIILGPLPLQTADAQVAGDTSAVRIPAEFRFNTNLKFGQTLVPDVKYLQRLLNSNPATQIGTTGPGSNSQLTDYFGMKTKDAVMRFQSLYRDDVLTPAGLTTPSGIVGEFSRRKLNSILTQSPDVTTPRASTVTQQDVQVSAFSGIQNQTSIPLSQSQVASYRNLFPQSTAIPQWWEQVLADTHGGQDIIDYTPQVLDPATVGQVTASSTATGKKPILGRVSPRVVSSDDQIITIYGSNFDREGVTLFSNIGIAGVVPQPENPLLGGNPVLRFRLKDFDDFERAKIYFGSTTQDIFFQVVNEELASDNAAIVTYAFPRYTGAASSSVPTATTTSNTSASQSGSLTNGIIAMGAVIGVGMLANSLATSFGSGAAASAAGAIDPMSLLNRPFGGKILFIHPCFDSANFLVYILKAGTIPRPIRLVYVPILSRLHQYFLLRPGANVIGTYRIGGWCTGGGGFVGGRIRQIGTSF